MNTGFIFEDRDGTIYFQDGKNGNGITQVSESEEVSFDNTYGMCLSTYDNYLYYRNFKEGGNFMRLEIANPNNREIVSDVNTLQTIIVDEMIYANVVDIETDRDGLYRISLDGTDQKKLVSAGINCMQYYSDYIYYAVQQKGQLFRIDLNGKNKEEIVWQDTGEYIETTHFFVSDGWIYFNNSNGQGDGEGFGAVDSELGACRIRIDGTELEELVAGRVANIYSNNELNYLLYTYEDVLYILNLETREVEQLLDKNIDWVSVIDDNIYALDWINESDESVIYKISMLNDEISIVGDND